eukprot:1146543-Pelagomonas_calceolata.AAC.5
MLACGTSKFYAPLSSSPQRWGKRSRSCKPSVAKNDSKKYKEAACASVGEDFVALWFSLACCLSCM